MNAKMIKKVDNKAEVSVVSNSNVTQDESVTEPSTVLVDAPTTTEKGLTDKDSQYKTLLVGMAPKLSPKSAGLIGYEVALNEDDKCQYLRLTSNDSGGLFSKEWVSLVDIYMLLEGLAGKKPFKSSTFKTVIKGGSANNVSFLSAVLRSEGIALIVQSNRSQFLHVVHTDWTKHRDDLSQLKPLPAATKK